MDRNGTFQPKFRLGSKSPLGTYTYVFHDCYLKLTPPCYFANVLESMLKRQDEKDIN